MINTAPLASNSVYGREKLFWYDKINFRNHVCHRCAVVKELLARADKPGSTTPGHAVFCFLIVHFFFLFGLCFLTVFFLLACCPSLLLLTLLIMHFYHNIYFKLKSEVLFWKRDFKRSWSVYWPTLRPDKNHKPCQDISLLWNSWSFFDVSWHHDKLNNTQYTTYCTNLHPTPTSDPLAKFKLALLYIVLIINIITLKFPLGCPKNN